MNQEVRAAHQREVALSQAVDLAKAMDQTGTLPKPTPLKVLTYARAFYDFLSGPEVAIKEVAPSPGKPTPRRRTSIPQRASKEDLNRLKQAREDAGVTAAHMMEHAKEIFGVGDASRLSPAQIDQLIKDLKEWATE